MATMDWTLNSASPWALLAVAIHPTESAALDGIINIHQNSGSPVLGAPASDQGMITRRTDRRVVGAVTPGIGIVRRRK
ncbi:hypothetical protein KAR91_31825 [Candidatus Pacearchaeota archaeon]|nr:hypothetical protein [Candidatus Pacearchaeota archaeon]